MADRETPDTPGSENADAPQPRPSTGARPTASRRASAASAASRARRIGGATRPAAQPRPAAARTPAGSGSATVTDDAPVTDDAAVTDHAALTDEPTDVDDATVTDDTAVEDEDERETAVTGAPAWLRWVPAMLLAVGVVVAAVIVASSAKGVWYDKPDSQSVRDQVLAAAKSCTATTNEYSYKSIAKDEARGLTCTTGSHSKQYRTAMQTIVKPSATKLKASQTVQINTAGIESVQHHGTVWKVLLFGQNRITQSGQSPRVDPFSVVTTMSRVDGTWLISGITNPNG